MQFEQNHNAIIGYAGAKNGIVYSNLLYKSNNQYIVKNNILEAFEVQTLDESIFCIRKELFFKLFFDEYVYNHWHLYASDLCLSAKEKFGSKIIVMPDIVYHRFVEGGLAVDNNYLKSMWRLCNKFNAIVDYISST